MRAKLAGLALAAVLSSALARGETPRPAHVAIFDFEMRSGSPEWRWLEKGLPDLATTDFIDRGVPVVARDNMEHVAKAVRWAPEMLTEHPDKIEDIRKQLQIDFIVSGTYSVESNRVTLSAHVVNIFTHQETFRTELSGSVDDVFKLQRELSASLLSSFSHRENASILPELKPWTKSIPAARALYEGMHLYDQGRYGDAWVKFRQASRQDPNYSDAAYWTARMYYFMDRYEHARLSFGDFVERFPGHPRIGDALKEYLHTYEKLDPSAQTLLDLYGSLATNCPEATVFNEMEDRSGVPARRWLDVRSGQVLGQIGRNRDAVERIAPSTLSGLRNWERFVTELNVKAHNELTGDFVFPESLAKLHGGRVLRFPAGVTDVTVDDSGMLPRYYWWMVAAPTGYVFKSLRFYPLADPANFSVGMHLHKDYYGDVPRVGRDIPLKDAIVRGIEFTNVPSSSYFHFHLWRNDNPFDRTINTRGLRAVAELEKVGPHGSLDVRCDSTHDFHVDVDGRMQRSGNGLVGPLQPGEHTVRFSIGRKAWQVGSQRLTLFNDWETNVIVRTGETTVVTGHLSWNTNSEWRSWAAGRLVGHDYPGYFTHLGFEWGRPTFQVDDEAIRIVWSYMGDLWLATSRDGVTFTPPEKFPMPISSGWTEYFPRLLRDSSGIYLLTFISDRNAQRENRIYLCWSRDLKHWSAPSLLVDEAVWDYDLLQTAEGRFLCANATVKSVTMYESDDAFSWRKIATFPLPDLSRHVRLLQRENGSLDLAAVHAGPRTSGALHTSAMCDHVGLFHSEDAVTWTDIQPLTQLQSDECMSISFFRSGRRTQLAYFDEINRAIPEMFSMQAQQADGTWKKSKLIGGIGSYDAAMTWHPKWGYLITWFEPLGEQIPHPSAGPYFMRGPDLKGVFGTEYAE